MTAKTFKRFYNSATVAPGDEGYAVVLDGRAVKTPGSRAELIVPCEPLAAALAEEWDRQGEQVRPETMPLTALACTALDVARPRHAELVEGIARYAETDVVCYRVEEPRVLAQRQQDRWQPLLDWLALRYDSRLNVTTGILPVRQPDEALNALRSGVAQFDEMRLAALSASVKASGSLVIGLAVLAGELDAEGAFDAAELESTFQIEHWGEDAEALRRRAALREELRAAHRFVDLLAS